MAAPKKYGPSKIVLTFSSYNPRTLISITERLRVLCTQYSQKVCGPIPIPTRTKKMSIKRSPHVNATSQVGIMLRMHKRVLIIVNPGEEIIAMLSQFQINDDEQGDVHINVVSVNEGANASA